MLRIIWKDLSRNKSIWYKYMQMCYTNKTELEEDDYGKDYFR